MVVGRSGVEGEGRGEGGGRVRMRGGVRVRVRAEAMNKLLLRGKIRMRVGVRVWTKVGVKARVGVIGWGECPSAAVNTLQKIHMQIRKQRRLERSGIAPL